ALPIRAEDGGVLSEAAGASMVGVEPLSRNPVREDQRVPGLKADPTRGACHILSNNVTRRPARVYSALLSAGAAASFAASSAAFSAARASAAAIFSASIRAFS